MSKYLCDIAEGNVLKAVPFYKFGENPSIQNAAPEMIWTGGGALSWLTTARTMSIASASANDTSAGTGMRTIRVEGLDANYDEIYEVVTLNGVTPVVTTKSYLRVNRMYGVASGSLHVNAGLITATATTDATAQCHIPAEEGQSQKAIYTVPRKCSLYITGWNASIKKASGSSATADCDLHMRNELGTIRMIRSVGLEGVGNSAPNQRFDVPYRVPEKYDIFVEALVSTNNTDISADFQGYCIKD